MLCWSSTLETSRTQSPRYNKTVLFLQNIIFPFLQVNLLNKVLGIVAGVLLIDHDVRATDFQQVPYHRIFIMLFLELNAPDQILETINFQVLTAYCNMLNILRPAKVVRSFISWNSTIS